MNTTDIPFGAGVKRAPEIWPLFWNNAILGWAGHIRVDNNITYKWLGDAGSPGGLAFSVLNNIQVTATRTVMSITSGPIDLNVTYLSPIEPSDPAKQSFPFTYISLTATTNDGQPHTVQVYSDISGEWVSGDRGDIMSWQTVPTDTILYHQVYLSNSLTFSEKANQAEDTMTYFAAPRTPQMTYMADSDANCRGQFSSAGNLKNTVNTGPKVISDHFNVFAISMDLGTVTATTQPVVWAVGMLRDPAIQAITSVGATEMRSPLWRTQGVATDMITSFLQDYESAMQRAEAFDTALAANASSVSPHLADLVAIAARQAMAGTELTVGGAAGSYNTSDIRMYMKQVGATGSTTARVNPVEIMYSAFPFFLTVNASYGGWLLRPVLDFAVSPGWANRPYAPRDIGNAYPNATGNPAAHSQGVEQCGNMLIMSLAYARATGDGSLISSYYTVLKRWADYLVNNTSAVPSDQRTADVGSRANSTNLAIKGIIAIGAMAQMSAAIHEQQDAQHYASVAQAYANTWKALALSPDRHILSNFGDPSSSWALEYNLYADKWIGTNLLDDSVYSSETAYVQGLLGSNANGLPISSDPGANGDTAWTLFTAMTMTDNGVRDGLIDTVWNIISRNLSGSIFSTGFALNGRGSATDDSATSPGVGAMFAPLALSIPNTTITVVQPQSSSTPPDSAEPSKRTNVGAVVGGVIGGVAGLGLILAVFLFKRRAQHTENEKVVADLTQPQPYDYVREDDRPLGTPADSSSREGLSPITAYLPTTNKALGAARRPMPTLATTPGAGSPSGSRSISSREPTTVASRSDITSPVSPEEVLGLRREVENLRLVMQSFQADALEPPPTYHEGDA